MFINNSNNIYTSYILLTNCFHRRNIICIIYKYEWENVSRCYDSDNRSILDISYTQIMYMAILIFYNLCFTSYININTSYIDINTSYVLYVYDIIIYIHRKILYRSK